MARLRRMIDVFEDRGEFVAVHHGWEQMMSGASADTAIADLHRFFASMRDDGQAHLLHTPGGSPATDRDIDEALAEIAAYAQEHGLNLQQQDPVAWTGDPIAW